MKLPTIFAGPAFAAAAVLSVGALAMPATAGAQSMVAIQYGPPPPARVEVIPAPRRGYAWAPGHYEWHRGRYVWVGGNWVQARPGYVYRAPQWVDRGGRWDYRGGGWDRDRDGVPDRYDSRPNNPYRR